ncbi:hypothetical protein IC575_019913 [Cucumis melo]
MSMRCTFFFWTYMLKTTALWITTDKKEEELGLHLEHPCFPFPPSLNRKWEGRWKGVGSFLLNPTRCPKLRPFDLDEIED